MKRDCTPRRRKIELPERSGRCRPYLGWVQGVRYHARMLPVLLVLYGLVVLWIARRRRRWLSDAWVPGLLGLFTLLFFWRQVSGDAFMPADGGDLASFLYPTYRFIQQSLKDGVWPLWNPHIYSGVPFVAEVQSGIFYPPHFLRFLLGPTLTYADMEALSLLHIWWAGVATFLLGRGLGLRRAPAILAAVAFMFSDLFIVHFGNLNLIAVASWLPLGLLGVHMSLQGGGLRPALGAGTGVGRRRFGRPCANDPLQPHGCGPMGRPVVAVDPWRRPGSVVSRRCGHSGTSGHHSRAHGADAASPASS